MLDPFVGGGTSVIEAQRLGAECFGLDVDPVAIAITGFQSRLADLPDLEEALHGLQERVGRQIMPLHRKIDANGVTRVVLHHFWVQSVICEDCGHRYDAHPHFQLSHDALTETQVVFCRACNEIHKISKNHKSFTCRSCREKTVVADGNVDAGNAKCPACNATERLIDLGKRTGARPQFRLFACETLPDEGGGRPIPLQLRRFERANDVDAALVVRAQQLLEATMDDRGGGLPDRLIPVQRRADDRLIRYGYQQYVDLFNPRQLAHLLILSREVQKLDEPLRESFAIAFSDHLKTNCMMTHYAFGWRRLAPLFAIRAYRHVPRPVELNPWIDGTGRGTYPNAVRSIMRAAKWAKAPTEYQLDGGFKPTSSIKDDNTAVQLNVRSADDMVGIGDSTIDLVITDPPYFDNIAYSELADFFHPWMRQLGLISTREIRGFPTKQLAALNRSENAIEMFVERLGCCFQEIGRTLKDSGRVVFTYQHSTARGWFLLARALAASPLRTVQVFPMFGDSEAGLHKHPESISWDAVIVARKAHGAVLPDLTLDGYGKRRANILFQRWNPVLCAQDETRYSIPDQRNFYRACLVGAALTVRKKKASHKGHDLLALLEQAVPEPVKRVAA